MDAKKIVELHQMATNYTREEMLRLNEEEETIFKHVGGIVEDYDEYEEQYYGKMNPDKVLALQRIARLYTREKMFQMNEERKEVMKNRDAYLFGQEENAGSIASGDIKMIEEVLSEFILGEYFDDLGNNANNEDQKVKKR